MKSAARSRRAQGAILVAALSLAFCAESAQDPLNPKEFPVIKELKKLYPETVLVENGRPRAIIVVPEAAAYGQMAKRLQSEIRTGAGATLPIRRAMEIVKDWRVDLKAVQGQNLIGLGNVNNNSLLAYLYGECYVVADSIYPGKGGHVVRTAHDPFVRGINVLVLAGSNPAGVRKAIGVFLKKYARTTGKSLVLPEPIVDVVFEKRAYSFFPDPTKVAYGAKRMPQYRPLAWYRRAWEESGFMDAQGQVITNSKQKLNVSSLLWNLGLMGETYFRTGDRQLLPLMKALVEKNRHLFKKPDRLHGMAGRASAAAGAWDKIEELPIWTDRDRLDITNSLLRDAILGHERRAMHKQVREGATQAMDENHGTNSALKTHQAWLYLHKYYHLPEGEYWMKVAAACFCGQASTFQVIEDAAGYLQYNPANSMLYAIRSKDMRYFERGIAREKARFTALACINNLGLATGFGDSSGLIYPGLFEVLARAAWYYRDPYLYWIIRNHLPSGHGLRIFQKSMACDLDVEPREPVEWTGVINIPIYEMPVTKGQARKEPVFAPQRIVDPKLFSKIIFKENWSPEGQYLLLDGAGVWGGPPGPHGHKHNDINTIINFTALGRMWLVDHTYSVRAFNRHSGVCVRRNGMGVYPKRTLASLHNLADTPDFGMTRTSFNKSERAIVWRKGRYFVVLDRVPATEGGEYFARCTFKALGKHTLRGKDLYLEQAGRYCKIVSDGRGDVDVEAIPDLSQADWRVYEHAEPVAKYFQQHKFRVLTAGESLGFINLLYAYDSPKDADAVTMQPLDEEAALIHDRGEPTLVGRGQIPGAGQSAEMFIVSKSALYALGVRGLCRGLVATDGPCDLGLDLVRKTLLVQSKTEAHVTLAGAVDSVSENGKKLPSQGTNGKTRLTLKPGKHVLSLDGWKGFDRAAAWNARTLAGAPALARGWAEGAAAKAQKPMIDGMKIETVKLDMPINVLIKADLDKDGREEWVGGGPKGVRAFRTDGTRIWSFDTEHGCRALAAGDVDADGLPEIAVGCDDEKVRLLDSRGNMRWSYQCKRSTDSLSLRPKVDNLWIADLEGDGKREVVAGANWVHVLNADGTLKWERYMQVRRGQICGDFFRGAVADLDGDGTLEVVAAYNTSYPMVYAYNCKGEFFFPQDARGAGANPWGMNVGVPRCIGAIDIFGGKKEKQIICADAGRLRICWHDQKQREDAGYYARASLVDVALFQPVPKQPATVFVATEMTSVQAHGKWSVNRRSIRGSVLWNRTLGEKISALLAVRLASPSVDVLFVGTNPGNLYVLTAKDGVVVARARLNGGKIQCFVVDDNATAVLAVASDGSVLRTRLTEE